MMRKLAVSGFIAAGAAGLILSSAPAQASEMNLSRLVNAELEAALVERAHPPATPKPKPKKQKKGKTVKVSKSSKDTKTAETEGHETDILENNKCNNRKIRIHINLKKAKKNRVIVYIPSKDTCKVKIKAKVKNHGKTSAKKVRQ